MVAAWHADRIGRSRRSRLQATSTTILPHEHIDAQKQIGNRVGRDAVPDILRPDGKPGHRRKPNRAASASCGCMSTGKIAAQQSRIGPVCQSAHSTNPRVRIPHQEAAKKHLLDQRHNSRQAEPAARKKHIAAAGRSAQLFERIKRGSVDRRDTLVANSIPAMQSPTAESEPVPPRRQLRQRPPQANGRIRIRRRVPAGPPQLRPRS